MIIFKQQTTIEIVGHGKQLNFQIYIYLSHSNEFHSNQSFSLCGTGTFLQSASSYSNVSLTKKNGRHVPNAYHNHQTKTCATITFSKTSHSLLSSKQIATFHFSLNNFIIIMPFQLEPNENLLASDTLEFPAFSLA